LIGRGGRRRGKKEKGKGGRREEGAAFLHSYGVLIKEAEGKGKKRKKKKKGGSKRRQRVLPVLLITVDESDEKRERGKKSLFHHPVTSELQRRVRLKFSSLPSFLFSL